MNLLLFFFLFLNSFVTSSEFSEESELENDVDYYDLLDEFNEDLKNNSKKPDSRHLQPDPEDVIPPNTPSKSANLFFSNILTLLTKNTAEHIDQIGKYSTENTQILLCEKSVNFAGFRIFIRLLYHFFKQVDRLGSGIKPSDTHTTFDIEYQGTTYENKGIRLKWNGESEFDSAKNVFIYTKFVLNGDCSQIPESLPEHPTQPIDSYITRLKNSLFQEILVSDPRPTMAVYNTFSNNYLFKKVKVQFCEENGIVMNMFELNNYLFKRYEYAQSFLEHEFSKEPFSNYQTNAIFSVTVNFPNGTIMRDKYTFRIEEKRNNGEESGWIDWWTSYLTVECPTDMTPSMDPQTVKDKFIGQVCGSIAPMINDGPSVESRTTFLSHMMQHDHQGFFAVICGLSSAPKEYKYFSGEYLANWSTNYEKAVLSKTEVEDYTNFAFKCVMQLTKNDKVVVKSDYRMKAYYEVNKWLIKEVKVGCEYF